MILANFSGKSAVILYMPMNMKQVLTLALLFSTSLPLHAEYFKDKYIFGAAYIRQYADLKAVRGRASDTGNGFGIYLDKYVKHQYRINSSLGYIKYSDFDITELVFSADYLIPVRHSVSAFAGAAIGLGTQKYHDATLSDSATGSIYGLQLGVIKYINNSHLLEFGIRQRNANIKTKIESLPVSETRVESLDEAYISVLFMF